ncbi:hypothetical protein BH11ACT3_BH11ACT3_19360 [soil metagenome]
MTDEDEFRHPRAAAILRAAALAHQAEFEALHRRILIELSTGPEDDRLGWADLQDPDLIADSMSEVAAVSYVRALEALQLDRMFGA